MSASEGGLLVGGELVKIRDVDTHVVEPADLWTSRVSTRWGDAIPHIEKNAGPRQTIAENFVGLSEELARKLLEGNAAHVYGL